MESSLRFPLDINTIKKIIPHREPFLMVDRVLSIVPVLQKEITGRVCIAEKHISKDSYFLKGHFPNNPIMPGVLILESIAQTGALCACGLEGDPIIKEIFFAGAQNVRFKKPVYPEDILNIKVTMNKNKFSFYGGKGEVTVKNNTVVTADIMAYIKFVK